MNIQFLLIGLVLLLGASQARAEEKKDASGSDNAQAVDVGNIKKKYWTKGEDAGLRVIQNRTYSKEGKVELGIFAGSVATDPFLNVRNLGVLLGYFFNDEYGFNAIYWKNIVSESAALGTLKKETGATANTNEPDSYYGGEFSYSPIYGKLSLRGRLIIYYDFMLMAGAGLTKTETGSYFTPAVGLGQQIYLAKQTMLRLNYRLTYYKENIEEKTVLATKGKVIGSRSTFNDVITLGITQLF